MVAGSYEDGEGYYAYQGGATEVKGPAKWNGSVKLVKEYDSKS